MHPRDQMSISGPKGTPNITWNAFSFNWLPSTLSSGRHCTSLHWTTFNGTFFHRLNFKIQVSNNHLKMVLICTSPFYLHLTYNHGKNYCVNWNIFFRYVSWNDTPWNRIFHLQQASCIKLFYKTQNGRTSLIIFHRVLQFMQFQIK